MGLGEGSQIGDRAGEGVVKVARFGPSREKVPSREKSEVASGEQKSRGSIYEQ